MLWRVDVPLSRRGCGMGRGGSGAFFLGLALFVVGVGASVFTYMNAAPGGTYVVFAGLIIGGLVRMVTALIAGGFGASAFATRPDKKKLGPQKPAWYEDPGAQYVEKLADVPDGYCWQCGTKLRRGRTICMACGAAQNSVAPQRNSSATPGVVTFGPPPKLAGTSHPYDYDAEVEPEPQQAPRAPQAPQAPQAPRPRAYLPTDPDGSYGWGPGYARSEDRGVRSNPGYQPDGQPRRSGSGDARRYVAPPPERDAPAPAPHGNRPYGSSSRHSGDLPPMRHSGDLPPMRHSGDLPPVRHSGDLPPMRHSGDLPPVGRRHSGPLVDDEPPPTRRATPSDDDRRQPPRGRRPADDEWAEDVNEGYDDRRRASSPRHDARPRPRQPNWRDDDGWDDDDRSSSSGRHPSRR